MPIYEYRCQDCCRISSQFLRSFSDTRPHSCSHCSSENVERMISKVAVIKPFMEDFDKLSSFETLSDFDENDPKSVMEMTKRIRKEMGVDFGSSSSDLETMMDAGVTPADLAADE